MTIVGTILLVSHDRDFLDRVVTTTLAPSDEMSGVWIEYAGGYSDMLLQKNSSSGANKNVKKQKSSKPGKSKNKVHRMSFKDKHALETLPEKIENLRTNIINIQNQMSDPEFYKNKTEELETSVVALSSKEIELAELEEQWLELELKREEIEEN